MISIPSERHLATGLRLATWPLLVSIRRRLQPDGHGPWTVRSVSVKGLAVFFKSWAIVVCGLWLCGCHRFHAESQAQAGVNFESYKTYSFSENKSDVPNGFSTSHLFNSIMQRRIRAELYRDLTQKGFQQVARSDASFVISFSTGGRQDVQALNTEAGTTPEGNVEGAATMVSRGALVIHCIDAKTNKVLWQGWVEAVMKPDDDLDEKVRAAVREVMKQFPPAAT